MKKSGFTLAEVLVTLAIVGVIAALTIPSLNSNVNSQKIGPSLANFVGEFENAIGMYMLENNLTTLQNKGGAQDLHNMEQYWKITPSIADNTNTTWTLKDGSTFTIGATGGINNVIAPGAAYPNAGSLCNGIEYDLNGNAEPNEVGQDKFYFWLADNGTLYPSGASNLTTIYGDSEQTTPVNGNSVTTTSNDGIANSINNTTITGAIAENNWSVKGILAYDGN